MGFKKTSELIAISFGTDELAPGTFIEEEVALQLDVLNNEIAVVLAIDIDVTPPDALAGINTTVAASVSTTSLTAVGNISQTNTMAVARDDIRAAGFVDGGVTFSRKAESSYTGDLDYLALIATNNFFVQLKGSNNLVGKGVTAVLTGNCGPNAHQVLSSAGIKVITGVSGKVKDAITEYKLGTYSAAQQANVPDQYGMGKGMGIGGGGGRGMGRKMGM